MSAAGSRPVRVGARPKTHAQTALRRHLELVTDYPADVVRPKTRGECADVPRPCPFVSCKWHLYLDADGGGSIRFNFPDLEPDEMGESCALDVADEGGATLDEIGQVANLTRERIRQVEAKGLHILARRAALVGLDAYRGHGEDRIDPHAELVGRDVGQPVPEETTSAHGGSQDRAAGLDEDGIYCDRVYSTYERRLRWGRP
jgi:hypothetical protein